MGIPLKVKFKELGFWCLPALVVFIIWPAFVIMFWFSLADWVAQGQKATYADNQTNRQAGNRQAAGTQEAGKKLDHLEKNNSQSSMELAAKINTGNEMNQNEPKQNKQAETIRRTALIQIE